MQFLHLLPVRRHSQCRAGTGGALHILADVRIPALRVGEDALGGGNTHSDCLPVRPRVLSHGSHDRPHKRRLHSLLGQDPFGGKIIQAGAVCEDGGCVEQRRRPRDDAEYIAVDAPGRNREASA